MEDVYIICHRMIYIFNITQEENLQSLNPDDYPTNANILRKLVDKIVNDMKFNQLSEAFQKIWMEDKFAYVSWGRDKLIEYNL
jgi:hypothetical protein